MSLTLHFHPLASYCDKALIALYENDTRVHGSAASGAICTALSNAFRASS